MTGFSGIDKCGGDGFCNFIDFVDHLFHHTFHGGHVVFYVSIREIQRGVGI